MNTLTHAMPIPKNFHRLRFLSVTGGFLDGQTFTLSTGLNCLIGARGTGKTTVLELVRYALDVTPSRDANAAERRRIESLVQGNLDGGRVQLGIETKDGLSYVVSRSWGEDPMVLTADGQPTEVTLCNGGVFKADIYSQNEVERIADQTTSQLHLVDNFEARQIAAIQLELLHRQAVLATNASQILPLQRQLATLNEELGTLPNVEAQLKAISGNNGDDAAEINAAHSLKGLRDREQRAVTRAGELLAAMADNLARLGGQLGRGATSLVDQEVAQGPNGVFLTDITEQLLTCGHDLDRLLDSAQRRVADAEQEVNDRAFRLSTLHKEQELAFRVLIEKYQQSQGKAAERMQLEKLRNDLLAKRRARDEVKQQLAVLQQQRNTLLEQLSEWRDKRFAIRKTVADRITKSLAPAVRVTVIQYGNPECYQRLLEDGLRGARMKHGVVAEKLANTFWPADLSAVIQRKDVHALIDKAELNQDQAEKTISALSDGEILFELEVVELLDQPRIELKDGEEYKDSLSLSTGQKCTAILPILLLDSENPLLVDQPEDNLDNRFIFETVVNSIRTVKQKRQLIFVTHNPNIPVLGDAERVFVLDSDGLAAHVANEGTVEQCKTEIVTLLEGGEEAFKLRKERYSY